MRKLAEPENQPTPDEHAEQVIRDAEMSKARLYEVSGKGHFVNTAQMD